MRFISHLDLVRLFQRSSRRAGLPVEITKGFSPRLKISITRALKLGVESEAEEAIMYMEKTFSPSVLAEKINKQLPAGIAVTGCEEII